MSWAEAISCCDIALREARGVTAPAAKPSAEVPAVGRIVRCDLHAHTIASSKPAVAALGWISCPECYSEPEKVYDQARSRGMDLVAITDHDTIQGAWRLVERGFQGLIVGQEVTVSFPEDGCRLHVLVWGLTPERDEELGRLGLREDVYAFARWLRGHNLAHSLAHPLYSQNGRLTRWHLDRCALLFKAFEVLNGAHAGIHRTALERYIASLTPSAMHRMVEAHGLEPLWPRIWEKARTAGSDDHGLLNVGRTWTGVATDARAGTPADPREFLKAVMGARAEVGGVGGHSSLLAHQLTTVAAHYAGRTLVPRASARARFAASKILRFAGVPCRAPSMAAVAWETLSRRLTRKKRSRLGPLADALRATASDVLARYPKLRERLDSSACASGSAMSEHEDMTAFFDDLYAAAHACLTSGTVRAFRSRDSSGVLDHLLSCLTLELTQVPYIFSLFHQNKDRAFVQSLDRSVSAVGRVRGGESMSTGVPSDAMRVLLFTDTYADINGPSRFVQNIADQARQTGRDLRVFTSTRLPHDPRDNVVNFNPLLAMKMPRYENLDVVFPPLTRMLREADKIQPDVIHISTPGPVGLAGLIAARMLRCPVAGVYHTDFPAYIDRLFDDHVMTTTCARAMRLFYGGFRAIFTRSDDYARGLAEMGIDPARLTRLLPGIDLSAFTPAMRDPAVWSMLPGYAASSPTAIRVLYCGRVSIEKNLPTLARVWKAARAVMARSGFEAELVIVGDGPYRAEMEREAGPGTRFLGFRHGRELSTIYASSDLFVFPSVTDTLGQVVMESQACGVPVLVTDQGGPKEVVSDGVTGLVLPADSDRAWIDAIVGLVRDTQRRRAMGRAAAESMQRRSIAASFDHFWSVHEQVLSDARAALDSHRAVVSIPRPISEVAGAR